MDRLWPQSAISFTKTAVTRLLFFGVSTLLLCNLWRYVTDEQNFATHCIIVVLPSQYKISCLQLSFQIEISTHKTLQNIMAISLRNRKVDKVALFKRIWMHIWTNKFWISLRCHITRKSKLQSLISKREKLPEWFRLKTILTFMASPYYVTKMRQFQYACLNDRLHGALYTALEIAVYMEEKQDRVSCVWEKIFLLIKKPTFWAAMAL